MIAKATLYKAFTLVELVVVLVILGCAASITALRYASPLQRARVETASQQWQSFDLFARQASRSRSVTIAIQRSTSDTTITLRTDMGETLRSWSLNSPLSLSLESLDGEAIDFVQFPCSEGSIDYRVRIVEGKFSRFLEIAGGTGSVNVSSILTTSRITRTAKTVQSCSRQI